MTRAAGATPRLSVASFVARGALAVGRITLDEDAAHHARVRRLEDGTPLTVRNGAGAVAAGQIARLGKRSLDVDLVRVEQRAPADPLHLLAPIGDRDRMLWLAEKAVEIGIASWRGVRWQRSRSVSPRGEGEAFVHKLEARMAQALAQSEGAWLPVVHDAADLDAVLDALARSAPNGERWVLDIDGALAGADVRQSAHDGICLALGPEGGLEPDELAACVAAGFRPTRLPGNVLRFETAGVVGVAFARAELDRRALTSGTGNAVRG